MTIQDCLLVRNCFCFLAVAVVLVEEVCSESCAWFSQVKMSRDKPGRWHDLTRAWQGRQLVREAGDDNLKAVLQKARWQTMKSIYYFETVKKVQLLDIIRTNLHRFSPVLAINCFLGNVLCEIKNNSDILYSIKSFSFSSKVSFLLHWCWKLGHNPVALLPLCKIPEVVFASIFQLEFLPVELFVCHT